MEVSDKVLNSANVTCGGSRGVVATLPVLKHDLTYMGQRDTLLCDTTYPNATTARSAPRECVRRTAASFKSHFDQVRVGASLNGELAAIADASNRGEVL